jgi:hypothetical protein
LAFNHAGGDIIDGSDRSRIGCSIESGGAGSLFFTTGNNGAQTERLRIASNGNIGIGTNNPASILQVGNGGRLSIANNTSGLTMIGTNDTDGATNTRITIFGNTFSGASGFIQYIATSTGDHQFYTGTNATERLRIASNGNIGIGTNATPTNSLTGSSILAVGPCGYGICGDTEGGTTGAGIYIGDGAVGARWKITHGGFHMNLYQNNGSGTYNYRGAFANSTGAYSSVSDKRLKKLIEPIQYGLNDVLKFKPVSYFMENQNEDIDKRNLGFIAQDLEDIIPEIVNVPSTSNAVYSLQYSSIIPILIKSIQELNDKIVSLNNTSNVM